MVRKIINASVCFVSLISGTAIYAFFGNNTYVSNLIGEIAAIDTVSLPTSFGFVRNYFADYLWALALSCGLICVLGERKTEIIVSSTISVALGCVWEILQKTDYVGGTGDILDMVAYLLAGMTAIFINAKEFKQ